MAFLLSAVLLFTIKTKVEVHSTVTIICPVCLCRFGTQQAFRGWSLELSSGPDQTSKSTEAIQTSTNPTMGKTFCFSFGGPKLQLDGGPKALCCILKMQNGSRIPTSFNWLTFALLTVLTSKNKTALRPNWTLLGASFGPRAPLWAALTQSLRRYSSEIDMKTSPSVVNCFHIWYFSASPWHHDAGTHIHTDAHVHPWKLPRKTTVSCFICCHALSTWRSNDAH